MTNENVLYIINRSFEKYLNIIEKGGYTTMCSVIWHSLREMNNENELKSLSKDFMNSCNEFSKQIFEKDCLWFLENTEDRINSFKELISIYTTKLIEENL